MKADSVSGKVVQFMRGSYYAGVACVPGGVIEDYLRKTTGSKGSTTDRRMRELENSGVLIKVEREGEGFKRYKLNTMFL